eukprot:gb/GECG01014221.1/.p1 GENE.gb/GECG01014221.1/~~gb/GECG01014221.1/.p1  ORF type:complete len:873 (+),score=118.18 gb/GECG01014221.1/:1-2619(+)
MASQRSHRHEQQPQDGRRYHASTPIAPSPFTPSASALSSSRMSPAYLSRYQETPAEKTRKRKRESWVDSVKTFFTDTVPGFSSIFKGAGTEGANNAQTGTRKQRRKTVGGTGQDNDGSLGHTSRVLFANHNNEGDEPGHTVEETPRSVKFAQPLIHSQVYVPKYISQASDSGSSQGDVQTELSFERSPEDGGDNGTSSSAGSRSGSGSEDDEEESGSAKEQQEPSESRTRSDGPGPKEKPEDTEGSNSTQKADTQESGQKLSSGSRPSVTKTCEVEGDGTSRRVDNSEGGNIRPSVSEGNDTLQNDKTGRDNLIRHEHHSHDHPQYGSSHSPADTRTLNGSISSVQTRRSDDTDMLVRSQRASTAPRTEQSMNSSSSQTQVSRDRAVPSRSQPSEGNNVRTTSNDANSDNVDSAREVRKESRSAQIRPSARKPTVMKKNPIVVVRCLLSKGHRPVSAQQQHQCAQFGVPRKFTKTPREWNSESIRGSAFHSIIPARDSSDQEGTSLGGWLQTSNQGGPSARSSRLPSAQRRRTYEDFDDGEISFTIPIKLRQKGEMHYQNSFVTNRSLAAFSSSNAATSRGLRMRDYQNASSAAAVRTPLWNSNSRATATTERRNTQRVANTNAARSKRTPQSANRSHPALRHSAQNGQLHQRRRRRSRLLWKGSSLAEDNDNRSVGSTVSDHGSAPTVVRESDSFREPDRPASVNPEKIASQVMSRLSDAVKNIDEFRTTSVVRTAQSTILKRSHPPFHSTAEESIPNSGSQGPLADPESVHAAEEIDDETLEEGTFQFAAPRVFEQPQGRSDYIQVSVAEYDGSYEFSMPQDDEHSLDHVNEQGYTFSEPHASSSPFPESRLTIDDLQSRQLYHFGPPHH